MSDLSLYDDVVVCGYDFSGYEGWCNGKAGFLKKEGQKCNFDFWSDTYLVKKVLVLEMASDCCSMLSEHKTLSATISLYDKLVGDANLNQSPLQKRRKKGKNTVLQKGKNCELSDYIINSNLLLFWDSSD